MKANIKKIKSLMGILLCATITLVGTLSNAESRSYPYELGHTIGANYVFEAIGARDSYQRKVTTITPQGEKLLSAIVSNSLGRKCISDVKLKYSKMPLLHKEMLSEDSDWSHVQWCNTIVSLKEGEREMKVFYSQQFGSLASSTFDHIVLLPILGAIVQKDDACGEMNWALYTLWQAANDYNLWCK